MIILNIYVILYTKKYIFSKDSLPCFKAEYAAVPGAGLTKDKKPSLVLSDRLDGAILLFNEGLIDKIIVSGDHKDESYSETEAMEKYLIERCIPKDKIFRDNNGFSTFETVCNTKRIYNPQNVIFVSQAFHLPRLVYTAKRFGINALGFKSNFHNYSVSKHRKWKLREIPSRFKDFFLATYYILSKKI